MCALPGVAEEVCIAPWRYSSQTQDEEEGERVEHGFCKHHHRCGVTSQDLTGDVIRCEQLTKRYHDGDILAVDRLDLAYTRGDIRSPRTEPCLARQPPSGAPTTLVVPTSGTPVSGIDVAANPALVKQAIGVVAQTNNLGHRALTVWVFVLPRRLFGMGARESARRLNRHSLSFRLPEPARAGLLRFPAESARRLQAARALMHGPSVLFLDEPTTGLDPQTRIALWEIVRALRAQGQSVLLTTHHMDEADERATASP